MAMAGEIDFAELMKQVRGGDPQAAARLVREFEPEIRRMVRCRLTDPRLRQTLDSIDICQSVLGRFFVHAATGHYDFDRPEQLLRLLATMARNKVRTQARYHQAKRRDYRRAQLGGEEATKFLDPAATPSRIASGRELLVRTLERLTEEERYLAKARADGRGWDDLAKELGESAEALRKRLARALDRVAEEVELDG
jgi:RNA polymerase sigma factor (sigma-70 family)